MSTHEPTAFNALPPATGAAPPRKIDRSALLALGGAGLAAAGLAVGLMLRPAPTATLAVEPTAAGIPASQVNPQPTTSQSVAQPMAQANAGAAPAVSGTQSSAAAPHLESPRAAQAPPAAAAQPPAQRVARPSQPPAPARTQHTQNGADDTAQWREPRRQIATCSDCGVIEAVHPVQVQAEASGLGAIAGGVVGGLLGNQVGGGNGRKAMTVLGAVGGTYAGNEIEKRTRGETIYEVRVRMDDGSVRTLQQRTAPSPGARVRVDGDNLRSTTARDNAPRYVRTAG